MSRKTDEEILNEMKVMKDKIREDKKKIRELNPNYNFDDDDEEESKEEVPEIEPKVQPQIVEREINLSLINDKLNFIISVLQGNIGNK